MRGAPALLNDPRQSFIMATGHFSREAMSCIYMPWILNRRLATVIAPMTQAKTPRGLRVRLQMREMTAGIRAMREGDVDIAEVAGKSFLVRLLHHLREPGGVVVIASDASWGADKGDGVTRPFAGYASQSFAVGTARLARLSQTPIVTCVPFIASDRHLIMEWSPVIPAPDRDDADADVRITNEILDWIERRIGERPDQYVLSFGTDRRWSAVARCWVDADRPEASNDVGVPPPAPAAKIAKSAS
jgi:lauroyl/myristoyl acyltransferase